MKRLYWRAPGVSRRVGALLALSSLACVAGLERWPRIGPAPDHADKLRAARIAEQARRVIEAEKLRLGLVVDPGADPAGSGLIGPAQSPVTSSPGYLAAKRTSANPNFAAVLVELFGRLGLRRGELAAVGVSGSFPGLNIATFAALSALGLEAIVVSSASASQWGATDPELTWLDMERVLVDAGVWKYRSGAASRGGVEDRGFGMSAEGLRAIDRAIARSGAQVLEAPSLETAIDRRMAFYQAAARGRPIRVYVNVGGGTVSVGTRVGKRQLPSGLNQELPAARAELRDSVMVRFLERGVPVIHLSGIARLARRHGLPEQPAPTPAPGEGAIFTERSYDRRLAALGLVGIGLALFFLARGKLGADRSELPADTDPGPEGPADPPR